MARPQKNNADYFSHDNDMRNDERLKAVRRKYKHDGYSVWNMLLEKLCKAADFTLEYNDETIELWAGDFEIEPEKLKEILEYLLKIGLITQLEKMIFSETLIKRFNGLLVKRKRQKDWLSTTKKDEAVIIDVDNTQSKVKKSKVKKSIVFTPPLVSDVANYFKENGYSEELGKKAFKYYSEANWKDNQGNQVKNWKQKMIGVWFKDENKKGQKVNGQGGAIL